MLAVFAGLVFLALGWHVYSTLRAQEVLRRKEEENNRQATLLAARRKELDDFFARPDIARLRERATFVNAAIDERSFDWTKMFMDLERIVPVGVRVVSIQPQLEKGRMFVRLTVSATGDESKIKFLRAMENSTVFSNVELLNVHNSAGSAEQALELNAVYVRG